jgi:hypothetical protein
MGAVTFACNNYFQTTAAHHVDAPHETPHLYSARAFDVHAIEPFDAVFVKTDYLDGFLRVIRPHIRVPFRLVTGHSDLSPSPTACAHVMRDPGILSWKAQNVSFETFKLRALPMGFAEPSRAFGDQDVVRAAGDKAAAADAAKKAAVAVPAASATHPVRAELAAAIGALAAEDVGTVLAVAGPERMDYAAYMDFLGEHEYALVPRGNAIDCHRVYECIVARTVPVLVTDEVPAFYARLPVIVLQPAEGESIYDVVRRFLAELKAGLAPPLPTPAEWEAAIDSFRVAV